MIKKCWLLGQKVADKYNLLTLYFLEFFVKYLPVNLSFLVQNSKKTV